MADSNLFTVKLVTPERILLDGLASEVILRTGVGDITILDGHTPVVGSVEPGVVRVVREDGQVERVAVHGGFIQVEQHVPAESGHDAGDGTRVTLLVGVAELAEEIDSERARVALEAAEAKVAELASSGRGTGASDDDEPDAELAEAEASRLRAQVRLEAVEVPSTSAA
jgi:F-type H+-transporting ATPase subunit epsilon